MVETDKLRRKRKALLALSKRAFLITGRGIIKDDSRGNFNPWGKEWKGPGVGRQADGVVAGEMSDNGIYWSFRDYKKALLLVSQ